MSQTPTKPDLVTVNIDGRDIAVPKGTNMIEAAALLGIEVPHFCYHPKLPVSGNCRMCLVEMGLPAVDPATKQPVMDPATGKQRVNWMPKPQIACFTNATPGLHIRTTTPQIKEAREGVMEFLLVNHPLDCPICDQAGECKLQEQSADYGRGASRFIEKKNVKPKRTQLGPRVTLDDERCILCSRCIRFTRDIAKQDVLGFVDRGSYSTLTCYPGRELNHNYSLNTVDICPVGALTSTDFRFKMRVWFLKTTPSIDTESSVGANTDVWAREGVIYRITPRRNDEVNDTWMTDSGRLLYKQVAAEKRLREPRVGGHPATLDAAIDAAVRLLKPETGDRKPESPESASATPHSAFRTPHSSVAVVGSGRQSVEEQYLTAKLAAALGAVRTDIVGRVGQGDGLLLSADRNPNVRGALVTGLVQEYPKTRLTELGAAIDAGTVNAVISFGEDLAEAGLSTGQLAKISLIEVGTHLLPTSAVAQVLIPALTVFEKRGSFINQQFRLQKFAAAVPGPTQALDDLAVLRRLIAGVSGAPSVAAADVDSVWSELAAQVPALAGLTWSTIPATGAPIDGSAWAAQPYVEGESLHFKPAAKTAHA
ncbi:MAG TPA: 2Fe-2S iron-sulfur cluster-binding protein [Opitutaceae bacterium]|nr:2Fe-2S iron-sulfur cluster-binding protein [Opitutaceae bacterium]